MVLIDRLVRVEHQVIVNPVHTCFTGGWIVIRIQTCQFHVQVVQPLYKIVPQGPVSASVAIHPIFGIVLVQFF